MPKPTNVTNRFYASVVGPAPRFFICRGCIAAGEIILGTYRGVRICVRCRMPAEVIAQGLAVGSAKVSSAKA
jgi:hypothetical protein